MPANLTTSNISNTYQGLLHFDAALPATGFHTVFDGIGNPTGLQLSRNDVNTPGYFYATGHTTRNTSAGVPAATLIYNQLNGGNENLAINFTRSDGNATTALFTTIYDGRSAPIAQFDPNSKAMIVWGDIVAFYSSDKALKDNIENIDNPLEKITKLNGVTFEWNDKQCTHTGKDVGVIAQDVEQVIPEAVTTRENGYKAVKYEKIIPLLIESIKELKERNETLEAKLATITL